MVIFLLMLLKAASSSQHCLSASTLPSSGKSPTAADRKAREESFPAYYERGVTRYELRTWKERRNRNEYRLSQSSLSFGLSPVYKPLSRFLQVQNPTDKPILVQPVLLLDSSLAEELDEKRCSGTLGVGEVLDEDEFDSEHEQRCRAEEEEVFGFAGDTSALPSPPPSFPGQLPLLQKFSYALFPPVPNPPKLSLARTSLLPKYKCSGECEWQLADSSPHYPLLLNHSQAFFISDTARHWQLLPPYSRRALGPFVFQPQGIGEFQGWLFIRNNLTVLERVEMRGEGLFARLAFQRETVYRKGSSYRNNAKFSHIQEFPILSFNISKEDLIDQLIPVNGQKRLPSHVSFTRMYEAQNVGTIPMHIEKILMEGEKCEMFGVRVEGCDEERVVGVKEMVWINVTYETSFLETELHLTLWILSDVSISYIPLEISLQLSDLSLLSEWRSVARCSWPARIAESALLIQTLIATGCLFAIGKEALHASVCLSKSIKSTRDHPPIPHPPPVPIQSPLLQPCHPSHSPESKATSPPPLLHTSLLINPPSGPFKLDPVRTRRVKKTKVSVLKFAPSPIAYPAESVGGGDKPAAVFASTRLMQGKKKKEKSEAGRWGEEGSNAQGDLDTVTTTHTEEELENVYLDDYKMRGLFNGFTTP